MSPMGLKFLHILALVFWLGPAFGGFWMVLRLQKILDKNTKPEMEKAYEEVLRIEHLSFLGLLMTGWLLFRTWEV